MLNSRRNEVYGANDVINSTDLRKRIINVDSRFRQVITESSTNFTYKFDHPYKNVIRARVASVEIPNVWYDFSKANYSNTFFTVIALDIANVKRTVVITIPDGNYTVATLISAVQTALINQLQIPYGIFFSIVVDPSSVKSELIHRGVAAVGSPFPTATARPFQVNFTAPPLLTQPFDFGLGSNLGFMNTCYTGSTVYDVSGAITSYSIESESIVNVVPDPYIFLAINDYNTVEQQTNNNSFETLAKIIVRQDKNKIIFDDGSNLLSNDIIYPSPVDLKQIKVKLLDVYGTPIDLNYCNFSFSLEITEVPNVKMYEFYRNYLWLGSIPSLPSNVTGAGLGLLGGKGP
jgi:hypothetical protein